MHLKRYSIPKYWKMPKKEHKFVATPRPGPHKKAECIPLLVLLRDVLKLCKTRKEAEGVIFGGEVLVDKRPRKDPNYPVGLMDVVEMPKIHKHYRLVADRHGLWPEEIKAEEAERKLCRIQGKRKVKGGAVQLSLHDGRNILTEKHDYGPNDSLLIELPGQKILHHFKFDRNAPATIISGKNRGIQGKVKEIFARKTMPEESRVVIQAKDKEIETIKEYVLVGEIR
jgi:small subunit ribosomal protein S4e